MLHGRAVDEARVVAVKNCNSRNKPFTAAQVAEMAEGKQQRSMAVGVGEGAHWHREEHHREDRREHCNQLPTQAIALVIGSARPNSPLPVSALFSI